MWTNPTNKGHQWVGNKKKKKSEVILSKTQEVA